VHNVLVFTFSDVILILSKEALSVNLLSPFVDSKFRPFVYAFSSICWAIVGVAGSCTRTSLTIHQASFNIKIQYLER